VPSPSPPPIVAYFSGWASRRKLREAQPGREQAPDGPEQHPEPQRAAEQLPLGRAPPQVPRAHPGDEHPAGQHGRGQHVPQRPQRARVGQQRPDVAHLGHPVPQHVADRVVQEAFATMMQYAEA
jgi:hypothetical protein